MKRWLWAMVICGGLVNAQPVLRTGPAAEVSLVAGRAAVFVLPVDEATYFRVVVNSVSASVRWRLTGPGEELLYEIVNPHGLPASAISSSPGTYKVEVFGNTKASVQLEEMRPARAEDAVRIEAEREFTTGEQARLAGGKDRQPVALAHYEQALSRYQALGDRTWEGHCLSSIGSMHLAMGDPAKAAAMQEKLIPVRQALGDRMSEAVAWVNWGAALEPLGQREQSIDALERGVALFRELSATADLAQALSTLANSFRAVGRMDEALRCIREARELAVRSGDIPRQMRALTVQGRIDSTLGDYGRARLAYEEALRLAVQVKSVAAQATAHLNIGSMWGYVGEIEQARARTEKALGLARAAGVSATTGAALNNLGWAEEKLGRSESASAHYGESLAVYRKAGDRVGEAYALTNLGRQKGDPVILQEALALRRATGDKAGEAQTLYHLAKAEKAAGHGPEALTYSDAALELVESLRGSVSEPSLRLTYAATVQNQYELNIDLLVGAKAPAAASLARSEQARARYLVDALTLEAGNAVIPVADIQGRVLDGGTVLLEYFIGEERSYAWLVTPGLVRIALLPARSRLEALVKKATPGPEWVPLLVTPLGRGWEGKRVAIVAHGALQRVPFAAVLPGNEVVMLPSASALAALRQRIEARPKGTKLLAVMADPVYRAGDSRVPGSGNRDQTGLARLLGSRREAAAIGALVPAGSQWKALDFDASRERVLRGELGEFRTVHIAAHAVFDRERPEASGIALSMVDREGRPVDGWLRARDVMRQRWAADLVVLSACETGLGKEVAGEGMMGLARAFLSGGVGRVVSTLWKVDDAATEQFMKRFYAAMLGPRRKSAAAALHEAQEWMRGQAQWRDPVHWAGFTVLGEWRN